MAPIGNYGGAEIRTFIAVDISEEVKINLDQLMAELKRKVHNVKWVKSDAIHLTLKFLGNVREGTIADIAKALTETGRGMNGGEIVVESLGAFPNPAKPQIVWAGMTDPESILAAMAEKVEAAMADFGFEKETRPFKPHLTIGRARRGTKPEKEMMDFIEREKSRRFGIFKVGEFHIYKSDLRPEGAFYTKLNTIKIL